MSGTMTKAAVIAHQLVLERLLARLFDEKELAEFRAQCLAQEDALYQNVVRKDSDATAFQQMLSTVESLFDGAKAVQQQKPGKAQ